MRAKKTIKVFTTLLTAGVLLLSCCLCGCSPHTHNLEFIETFPSTCTVHGVVDHWHCTTCGMNFEDESAQIQLESIYIALTNHSYTQGYLYDGEMHLKQCAVCGYNNVRDIQAHVLSYGANDSVHYLSCYCGYAGAPEEHVYNLSADTCSICNYGGLLYQLSDDKSYYICMGASESYKQTVREIEVPLKYKGLPVKEIGTRAFQHCPILEKVTLGRNVIAIGDYAFYDCVKLNDVSLNEGLMEIATSAFSDCVALEQIQFPSTLMSVGNRVFYECTSLKKAEFASQITELRAHTFYGCSSLTQIEIGKSVNYIEMATFCGTAITEIVIPNGVTEIPMTMCLNCRDLTTVTIPASVKSIGGGAFSNCTNLQTIIFLGTQEQWNQVELSTYPQAWNHNTGNYKVVCMG